MKTLSLAGLMTVWAAAPLMLTGCETFRGETSVQKPPNSIGSGNTEDAFNPRTGAYDEQTPVGVDNAAAAGR